MMISWWSVVFFEIPLSSVFARLYAMLLRQEDIRIFREARIWGTPVLRPQLSFKTETSQISARRILASPAFSVELARAWVKTLRTNREIAPMETSNHCPN